MAPVADRIADDRDARVAPDGLREILLVALDLVAHQRPTARVRRRAALELPARDPRASVRGYRRLDPRDEPPAGAHAIRAGCPGARAQRNRAAGMGPLLGLGPGPPR